MAKAENVKSSLCLGYVLQWFCLFRLSQGDKGRTFVRPGRQILDLLRTKIGFSSQKLGKNRTRTYSGYKLDICWTNSWCRTKVGQKLGYPHCQPAPCTPVENQTTWGGSHCIRHSKSRLDCFQTIFPIINRRHYVKKKTEISAWECNGWVQFWAV